MEINITHIDTACILLEINGYKIMTDPTLDNLGQLYHHGFGSISRKTENPVIADNDLKDIDLILLSHHQHKDNFDEKGRAFAATVANIISTKQASKAIKGVKGIKDWESYKIETDKLPNLKTNTHNE